MMIYLPALTPFLPQLKLKKVHLKIDSFHGRYCCCERCFNAFVHSLKNADSNKTGGHNDFEVFESLHRPVEKKLLLLVLFFLTRLVLSKIENDMMCCAAI